MTDFLEKGTRFVYRGRRAQAAVDKVLADYAGANPVPPAPAGYDFGLSRRGSGIVHLIAREESRALAACGATRVFVFASTFHTRDWKLQGCRPCRACYRIASES